MFTSIKRRLSATSDEAGIKTDGWMVTFTDVIMLIITFFVMLLTMSSVNQKSFENTLKYLKEAVGGSSYSDSENNGTNNNINAMLNNLDKSIGIKKDERGIALIINENILFETGKYTIRKDNYRILDSIADGINSCSNEIMIMGHTDDLPVQDNKCESNWELAAYRGLSVLDYFIKNKNFSPSRFYVGGYGASRPLVPNNSSKHRSLNRRVEIIFKHKEG
jgi:chemotaxis protein MotB